MFGVVPQMDPTRELGGASAPQQQVGQLGLRRVGGQELLWEAIGLGAGRGRGGDIASMSCFRKQLLNACPQLFALQIEMAQDSVPVDQPPRRETIDHVQFGRFILPPSF